jgi:glycosyltransferase involved in cell wall biosynthesis
MRSTTPIVSFGLPVRNGERHIHRVVDSLLAQSFQDIEVVISDNASTDRTPEICREYAARDPRVRYSANEKNIGVLANFNRLPGLARGTYYRWMGCDDWLEPDYAAECVAAFAANPAAIAVTTYQAHVDDEGRRVYHEHVGPRVTSSEPHARFGRMLWFLHQPHWLMDPIFSLYRRDVLLSTRLHRHMARADRILAAELSLKGPYAHVPRHLSNRRLVYETESDVTRRVQAPEGERAIDSQWKRLSELFDVIRTAPLTPAQRTWCHFYALRYFVLDVRHEWLTQRLSPRLHALARRLGLSRARLRSLTARTPNDD